MSNPIPGLDRRQFLRAAAATGALASSRVVVASHDDGEGNHRLYPFG